MYMTSSSAPGIKKCLITILRYVSGQQFKFHKDGAVTNEAGQTSKLSYLVYLNDDCEGGATRFRESYDANGKLKHEKFIVSPATGTALLFRHERWHEGAAVISGSKYVLRSNVFYSAESREGVKQKD